MDYTLLTTADASLAAFLKTANTSQSWIVQLWNAPGFSEFAVGVLVALSSIGIAIYNNRNQKNEAISEKRKEVAEKILEPFNEFLLESHTTNVNKDEPLLVQAARTVYYKADIDVKEFKKQVKKAETLAKLYSPNYIQGQVSNLSLHCLSMAGTDEIEKSYFEGIKDSIDELSKDLMKWIKSGPIKGRDKTIWDIAKEVEAKSKKKGR